MESEHEQEYICSQQTKQNYTQNTVDLKRSIILYTQKDM